MGNFYIGTQKPSRVYVGTNEVSKIYLGTEQVWSKAIPIGGRIFYVNPNSNGATYKFYDSQGNELQTQTVEGLANAYSYAVFGTPSSDKFYAYDNTISDNYQWASALVVDFEVKNDYIGSGKTNTLLMLDMIGRDLETTIWGYVKTKNYSNYNGHNDWYIGSMAEQTKLNESELVDWYSNKTIWSSVQRNVPNNISDAHYWVNGNWSYTYYTQFASVFLIRSF